MSATIVSQAVGAVIAALGTAPAVCATIERTRLRPWGAAITSAIAVRPHDAQRDESAVFGGPDVWSVRLLVECYARSGASTPADVAVDSLLQAANARLMTDPTLGGAVRDLVPEAVRFDFDVDGDQTACATLQLTARMTCGPSFT